MDKLTESLNVKYSMNEKIIMEPESNILITCLLLILLPYLWSLFQESEYQGIYETISTIVNLF